MLYLEHISVYVQYIINTYVIECCSKVIILYCGVRSSYPLWAIVPCVLIDLVVQKGEDLTHGRV